MTDQYDSDADDYPFADEEFVGSRWQERELRAERFPWSAVLGGIAIVVVVAFVVASVAAGWL